MSQIFDTAYNAMTVADMARVASKFAVTDACWEWQGALDREGYSRVNINGVNFKAYVAIYRFIFGKPHDSLDHLCRNRGCVNPRHLEAVSRGENTMRGEGFPATRARQTHCVKGHSFNKKNTYIRNDKHRQCRACRNLAVTAYNNKRKALLNV